jgi:hypothetical protein
MKVNWVVDTLLTERAEDAGYPTLAEAARELGHIVYQTKYVPFSKEPFGGGDWPFARGECVITYGTLEFCRQIEKSMDRFWTPGMYLNANVKSFSKFAAHMGDDLLNSDYVLLPFAEAKRRFVNQDPIFIKPESGLKEFTGQLVYYKEDFDKLSPYHKVDDDTLVVVAKPKYIKAEFRYVIADSQVITGSEYRWDNKLDVRSATHPICDALVKKVAEAEWQADTVYVCDIAIVTDEWAAAKVIELNAFSSSGLYACDTYKIVEAVSKAAWKEHCGGE